MRATPIRDHPALPAGLPDAPGAGILPQVPPRRPSPPPASVTRGDALTRRTRPARRRRSLSLLVAAAVAGLLPATGPAFVVGADPAAEEVATGSDIQAVRIPFSSIARGPVAPGISHDQGVWTTDRGSQWVNVVDVDLQNPVIRVQPGLSNGRVTGLETLGGQAARVSRDGYRVVAAINGDVWAGYTSAAAHAPNGLHIENGEVVSATRIKRPTLGIFPGGTPRIADVGVDVTVTFPDGITILGVDRINKARRFNELALFTRRFGTSTLTGSGGVEVVVQAAGLPLRASGTYTGFVTTVRAGGNTSIPPGSLVLSADGLAESALRRLTVGSTISFATSIDPGWEDVEQAIGGREWVLRDGQTWIYPRPASADQIHPRTGVGITPTGDLVLIAVDGRQAGYSDGTTLPDLAELFRQRGAIAALNLDGGGSTTMLVREPGDVSAGLANLPSGGRQRPVSNSLLVVSTAPTGPLSTILLKPTDPTIVQGTGVTFTAKGHDTYYNGIPLSGSVAWSTGSPVGTIDASGRFASTVPGTAQVTASAFGVSASTTINVVPDTVPPVTAPPVGRMPRGSIPSETAIPFELQWPAAIETGSGVLQYRLRQRIDGGEWLELPLPSPAARSLRVALEPGRVYEFGVSADDLAGNVGAWADSGPFSTTMWDESAVSRYAGKWRTSAWTGYLGGSGSWSGIAGSTARFQFTGTQIAWIAPYGPTRGSARVYVDGRVAATVSLYRRTTSPRRIAWSRSWSSTGTHTVVIRVLGTGGRPKVDVDGFAVLGPAALPVPLPAPAP